MSSLPFETSNVFLSILTLFTLYNSLVSITPPNPNPYAGQSTKSAPAEKNPRPNDTVAFTAAPLFVQANKAWVAAVGLCHAVITLYYPAAPSPNICPNPANLSPQMFTWSWATLALNTLAIAASLARRQCFAQLGKAFTFQLTAPKKLITTGMYGYMQHPSYTFLLVVIFSYLSLVASRGGLLSCWISVSERVYWSLAAAYLASVVWTFSNRVMDEEKILRDTFGKEWEIWHQKTKRFIPGLI